MHKVGQAAHTAHGIGEIVEIDPGVRGSASYKVSGRGFSVWIDGAKLQVASNPDHYAGLNDTIDPGRPYEVNKDNSTTLPYDYTPQHHVDMFAGEQTIQPGDYEIDPDERLHASDSLSGEQRKENRPYPGPNPDLFAKSARSEYDGPEPGDDPYYEQHSADLAHEREQDEHAARGGGWPHHAAFEDTDPSLPDQGDDEWHEGLPDGPERTFGKDARMHEDPMHPQYGLGSPGLVHPTQLEYDDPGNPDSVATLKRQEGTSYSPGEGRHYRASLPGMEDHEIPGYLEHLRGKVRNQNISMGELSDLQGLADAGHIHPDDMELHEAAGTPEEDFNRGQNRDWDNDAFDPREFGASYRPAGLSNRYAHILEANDHSEVGQFRADPVGYQQRLAHVMTAGDEDYLIEKFADYTNLLDSDEHMRTAAWKDVAAKAKRLRADGAVHPEDIGPNRIMATVDGDNAQYKTLVLRGPGYAGIGKGANSATFSCTCSWGKWAFKRQFTFVGRMCSHALATLWELQSHTNKGNGGTFKSAGVTDEFKKWADDNNDGHIDQGCIQDFLNTKAEDFTREDVNKLYDYVDTHHQQAPERDYDIPYTLNNEQAYKTSEILRTRPMSLTPDLREVPKNDEHEWTDVTEDDRETTGPDQIVHFSRIMEALHRTADGGLWNDVKGIGGGIDDVVKAPFNLENSLENTLGDAVSAPVRGLNDLRNQRLQDTTPAAHSPAQPAGGDYHMDQGGVGGIGRGSPGGSMSINDYLHPPAAPAGAAGATRLVPGAPPPGPTGNPPAPAPAPAPPGGPSAPGNPAVQAPSSGDTRGFGRSGPADPNGTSGGGAAIGQGTTYHVNQGDTLSDIAGRAGLGKDQYQQIADANKDLIKDPNHIETGWDLKIPGTPGGDKPSSESVTPPKPADASSGLAAGLGQAPPPPAGAPQGSNPGAPSGPPPTSPPGMPPAAAGLPPGGQPAPPNPGGPPVGVQPSPGSAPIDNKPFHPVTSRRRYAESSDANLLDKLRQKSIEPASDDLQHMDARNDEIRDLVEELNDRGLDASFMVASLHYADSPADGDANFMGHSYPNWADESFQGSGPDPRHYISDSQSYLDQHEPDLHDVTDEGDIVKFNDSRSKPQQGPRHTSSRYGGDQDIDAPAWEHADFYGRGDEDQYDDHDQGGGGGFNSMGGGGEEGGEGLAEEAPELLALASVRRRGGPRHAVRVDPGARGARSQLKHSMGTLPEPEDPNTLGSMEEPDPLATPDMAIDASYHGDDLVANFQRSAAAQDLWSGESSNSGGMFSDDAIAANAQAMLRTAGRKFTQQEQRDLEEEAHILGARNIPTDDDLAGTHYLMGL